MANGKLGKGVINANSETTLTTISNSVSYATVQLIIVNRSASDTATIRIAICDSGSSTGDTDYIEYDVELAPNCVYYNNVLILSANEQIRVTSNKGNLTYRVAGIEK